MRPVPLTPAPSEERALLKWCKDKIAEICRASQVDTAVTKDKQNAGKFLARSANLSDVADAQQSFDNIKQDASESYTGVVELATEDETLAGTSDGLATHPKGVKAVVDAAVTALRGGVDSAFDTLKKLADELATKLTAADNLSDVADPVEAFDNIKQVATTEKTGVVLGQQTAFGAWVIETPEDKDYRLIINLPYAFSITSVTTRSTAGTATATVKINSTPLGGSANNVSTSEQTQTHDSANEASAGDDIVLTISGSDGCEGLSITIAGAMELATS